MFEINIGLVGAEELRVKTVRTPYFGLWVNRYPQEHEHRGEIRDIKLIVREGDQEIYYNFVSFTVSETKENETAVAYPLNLSTPPQKGQYVC